MPAWLASLNYYEKILTQHNIKLFIASNFKSLCQCMVFFARREVWMFSCPQEEEEEKKNNPRYIMTQSGFKPHLSAPQAWCSTAALFNQYSPLHGQNAVCTCNPKLTVNCARLYATQLLYLAVTKGTTIEKLSIEYIMSYWAMQFAKTTTFLQPQLSFYILKNSVHFDLIFPPSWAKSPLPSHCLVQRGQFLKIREINSLQD